MANFGPASAWLTVGGCDVTGDVVDMQETIENVIEECHPFLSGATVDYEKSVPVGVAKVNLETGQGVYDTRVAGMLATFQGTGATRQLVDYGLNGCVDPVTYIAKPAVMIDGDYVAQWTRKATRANITMGVAKHSITGARYPGYVVSGKVSRSGDGNTQATYWDSTGGTLGPFGHAIFDLQVTALDLGGGSKVVVKVQDSPDHISWADVATFADVVAADTAERVLVTHALDRYLSVMWTFTGGSAQTVTAVVCAYLYT